MLFKNIIQPDIRSEKKSFTPGAAAALQPEEDLRVQLESQERDYKNLILQQQTLFKDAL